MTVLEMKTSSEILTRTIDRFWETFPAVWNAIRTNLRAIVTENFDISVEQFHILRHIRKGSGSVSELAEVKQISRPAISQAVDVLVEKGLISRHQDAEDRRFVHLALTPAGDDLLNAIFKKNRAWMEEKMAALGTADYAAIIGALDVLESVFVHPSD